MQTVIYSNTNARPNKLLGLRDFDLEWHKVDKFSDSKTNVILWRNMEKLNPF